MKIIVYTANIGSYDRYNHVYIKNKGVEFVYFTDVDGSICGWDKHIITERKHKDNTREARYYKCNPHLVLPDHDVSIWVDARFIIKAKNIVEYVKENFKRGMDIACYPHLRDVRNGCSYVEAFVCGAHGIDDHDTILRQITRYKKEGFPKKFGLFSTGIIIRKNNDKVNKFNETWWEEVKGGSKRDQISQMYSAWKTGVTIHPIEGSVYNNKLVRKGFHLYKTKGV